MNWRGRIDFISFDNGPHIAHPSLSRFTRTKVQVGSKNVYAQYFHNYFSVIMKLYGRFAVGLCHHELSPVPQIVKVKANRYRPNRCQCPRFTVDQAFVTIIDVWSQ